MLNFWQGTANDQRKTAFENYGRGTTIKLIIYTDYRYLFSPARLANKAKNVFYKKTRDYSWILSFGLQNSELYEWKPWNDNDKNNDELIIFNFEVKIISLTIVDVFHIYNIITVIKVHI